MSVEVSKFAYVYEKQKCGESRMSINSVIRNGLYKFHSCNQHNMFHAWSVVDGESLWILCNKLDTTLLLMGESIYELS